MERAAHRHLLRSGEDAALLGHHLDDLDFEVLAFALELLGFLHQLHGLERARELGGQIEAEVRALLLHLLRESDVLGYRRLPQHADVVARERGSTDQETSDESQRLSTEHSAPQASKASERCKPC